jgi:hypothetical protein
MSDQSDHEQIEIETPLLKKKSTKKYKEINIEKNTIDIVKDINEKPIKEKKPRSDKQIEQFKKVIERKKETIEENKYNKKIEASKLLMDDTMKKFMELEKKVKNDDKKKKVKPIPIVDSDTDDDESEPEPEPIVIKKKSVKIKKETKPKKGKAKLIIYESDSDTDSEVPPTPPTPPPAPPQRILKSQLNKKSIMKISNPTPKNYFVE